MINKNNKNYLIIIFVLILIGCSRLPSTASDLKPNPSSYNSTTPTIIGTMITTPIVITKEPHLPLVPSNIAETNNPTNEVFISSITPTIYPTISPDKRDIIISNIIATNGDCKLPCLWGFLPGKTPWSEVDSFYKSLGVNPKRYEDVYFVELQLISQGISIGKTFAVNEDIVQAIRIRPNLVRNHQVVYGDSSYYQLFHNYYLQEMFTEFGKPEEIWVRTFPGAPEGGEIPFYILINYPNQGISILYDGNVEKEGNNYIICPRWSNITAFLWNPTLSNVNTKKLLWEYYFISESDFKLYKSLEEASGMSVNDFYQETLTKQACFYTNSGIWSP